MPSPIIATPGRRFEAPNLRGLAIGKYARDHFAAPACFAILERVRAAVRR